MVPQAQGHRTLAVGGPPLSVLRALIALLLLGLCRTGFGQSVPREGTVRALLVFVRFADDTLALGSCSPRSREWADADRLPAVADSLLASTALEPFPERSLSAYFEHQSRGTLALIGEVYPSVYVTQHEEAAYEHRYGGDRLDVKKLSREILFHLNDDPDLDFSTFDANRDGFVDQIFFVLRTLRHLKFSSGAPGLARIGYESGLPEFGHDPRALKRVHANFSGLYVRYGARGNIFPEVNLVRLLAHEFVHNLSAATALGSRHLNPLFLANGAPAGHNQRIGYALMIGGAESGDVRGDETLSAYERSLFGPAWVGCTALSRDTTVAVADLYTSRAEHCYTLDLPGTDDEPLRLYLSNRQRIGFFDRLRTNACTVPSNEHGLKTTGLLAMLTQPEYPTRMAVLPADNTLELSNRAAVYEGDLFGPGTATQLTPWTTPSINGYASYPADFAAQDGHFQAIDRIRYTGAPDGEMAFDYIADFRRRPVIREDSYIGPETERYTFTGPVVVANRSTLTLGADVTFADTLQIERGSTVVVEPEAVITISERGTLVMQTESRLIVNAAFRNEGREAISPGAEVRDGTTGRAILVGDEQEQAVSNHRALSVYPNPSAGEVTLTYGLSRPGRVRIRVFDTVGREVAALVDEVQASGGHRVAWAPGAQANGVYFCRIETEDGVAMQAVTLVR